MKWKTTPDGHNVAACPVEDWLIARHEGLVILQLRYQSDDAQGSTQVRDEVFALPSALAEQLAAQLRECSQAGAMQRGNPNPPTVQ